MKTSLPSNEFDNQHNNPYLYALRECSNYAKIIQFLATPFNFIHAIVKTFATGKNGFVVLDAVNEDTIAPFTTQAATDFHKFALAYGFQYITATQSLFDLFNDPRRKLKTWWCGGRGGRCGRCQWAERKTRGFLSVLLMCGGGTPKHNDTFTGH